MFKEILKIIPKLDSAALNAMTNTLGKRFAHVAKKFGGGLVAALKGGGVAGAAIGLIDKLLNPLDAIQVSIDKTLAMSDDVVTNAKAFNTTAGKLFRLQQIAKSTGLDESSLDVLIQKFQTAVAEAAADPTKVTSVRKFVGQSDTAEAFFGFIQSLQKLSKNQQLLVQQEVFGEKQILRMADFLQTDFPKQAALLGGPGSGQLDKSLNKLGDLNDLKDLLAAQRALKDANAKGRVINEGMVRTQAAREARALEIENTQIQSYQTLSKLSVTVDEGLNAVRELGTTLAGIVVDFKGIKASLDKLIQTPIIRGILKYSNIGGGR